MSATRPLYAENTKVSVESSKGDIMALLRKHGVKQQAWAMNDDEEDILQFWLDGKAYRLNVKAPTTDEIFKLYPNHYDTNAKIDGELRRRWRATLLMLKAKLEFADGVLSDHATELMPYLVLDSGQTVREALAEGGLPLLTAGGR
jgi:hypothetical protein